ncbi:MAG TPA: CAP domain-containing protein, partial [Candidatus Gracilibacteria bacterium]
WYAPYICFAKSKGIVKGYEDGTFGVERSINQAEALKIILETYQKDIPAVAGEWYDRYFIKADTLGMGYFHTEQPAPYSLTRGEMAYFVAWNLSDPPINQMPWGEPQDVSSDPPLSDTSGAYIPPAPHVSPLQVLSNAHPGQQITTGYITDYHQWALANYAPSISNHTLDKASVDDLQKKLLQAVNQAREDEGKSALKENAILTKLSQEFATHLVINGFYSHSDKLGQDPFDRAEQAKYTGFVTESMTWQQADPLDSITWWKGSDLHWNNIANPDYTQVGVGIVKEPNGRYIVILMTGE